MPTIDHIGANIATGVARVRGVRPSIQQLIRSMADEVEAKLNDNDWNGARALLNHMRANTEGYAVAVEHDGPVPGHDYPMTDDEQQQQAEREAAQRLSQEAVSGAVGADARMVRGPDGAAVDMGAVASASARPRRVGGGWVG